MIDEADHADTRNPPAWRRKLAVAGACAVMLATVVFAVILFVPDVILSNALRYETASDRTSFDRGYDAFRKEASGGRSFGLARAFPLDRDSRYILLQAPWFVPTTSKREEMARCWAIIDTDREAIVGSIWLTAGSSAYCGVQFESIDADAPQRLTADSSSLSWIVQGHGSLPGWWPRSEHREENGSATHSERVIFDTTIARWCRPERLRQPPTNDRTNLWIRDSNRTLPLPDSNDEIVVMHQRENDKSIPSLAQLVRRNRADGRVVWEIGTDAFRCDDFPEALFQIVPPIGPLDTKSDWCCLVQIRWKPGMWLDQQCWRLDLATGDVVRLDLPISSAVDGADVAADGQSLLLVDAGYVRKVYSGGISSTATGKTTTDLMVWHPDQPARSVFQLPRVLMQMTPLPLPRSRVLVVADDGSNRQLQVAIVPLDGGEAHLLFP